MKLLGMGGGGLDFSEETGYRDVFLEGKCDDGCLELAKMLGWEVWNGREGRKGVRGRGG